nr:3-hydroxyacyl-CoA dehydrogenase family protein [Haloarcula hispanica]
MHVAILGAGTMGHGIAQVSAMAGHDVTLRDIDADIVDDGLAAIESNLEEGIAREKVTESTAEATLDRLTGTTSLEEAVTGADLVVEAVPEDMDIKHETLTEVESHVDPATLIASNTSSLSLTEIASVLNYPDRAIGLHFFNPVHIMALVEIVVAEQTSAETVARAREFVDGIDKTPVEVADAPGFASSRLGVSLGVVRVRRRVPDAGHRPHQRARARRRL